MKKPSRKAKRTRALATGNAREVTKSSRIRTHVGLDDFEPRPAHIAFARAYGAVVDSGAPVTFASIAKQAGVARETFSRLRARYPGLWPWMNRQLELDAMAGRGGVLEKCRTMAMRGSPAHITIYLNAVNGGNGPAGGDALVPGSMTFNGPTIIKMGVPGPGDPPLACSPNLKTRGDQ